MSDIGIFDEVQMYEMWAAIAAFGAALAWLERRVIGRHLLWILLLLTAAAGLLTTQMSPFTFSGNDYYMVGVIASAFALLIFAGYAAAAIGMAFYRNIRKRGVQ